MHRSESRLPGDRDRSIAWRGSPASDSGRPASEKGAARTRVTRAGAHRRGWARLVAGLAMAGSVLAIAGISAPAAGAITPPKIFFSNGNDTGVESANLDFTAVNNALVLGMADVVHLAVGGGHLYWVDENANAIGVSNLDGTAIAVGTPVARRPPHGSQRARQRTGLFPWVLASKRTLGQG
jgi:hypothetical protein